MTDEKAPILGHWVQVIGENGEHKDPVFIPYPTRCPPNCPGNHSAEERKELGPPIVNGKRVRR